MSSPPPITTIEIKCRKCGRMQTRTFRAWVGTRVSLPCHGCDATLIIVIEP